MGVGRLSDRLCEEFLDELLEAGGVAGGPPFPCLIADGELVPELAALHVALRLAIPLHVGGRLSEGDQASPGALIKARCIATVCVPDGPLLVGLCVFGLPFLEEGGQSCVKLGEASGDVMQGRWCRIGRTDVGVDWGGHSPDLRRGRDVTDWDTGHGVWLQFDRRAEEPADRHGVSMSSTAGGAPFRVDDVGVALCAGVMPRA